MIRNTLSIVDERSVVKCETDPPHTHDNNNYSISDAMVKLDNFN